MRLKLDENLGEEVAARLRLEGHDVTTVHQQRLEGTPDPKLIEICRREVRALVTLDVGFANRLAYPPHLYAGIALIRLPPRPALSDLVEAADTLARALTVSPLAGHLWIVQRRRVREYEPPDSG